MPRSAAILMLAVLTTPRPSDAADIAAGQAVFDRCKICHAVDPQGRNTAGPSLHGLFGRKAGASGNFAYSQAMRNSAIVWDDDTLAKYLRNPRDFIPGNNMAFPGITDDQQIASLLLYLHQATQ